MKKLFTRPIAILVPLAIAAGVITYLIQTQKEPTRQPPSEIVRTLRIIKAPRVDLVPRATGFGVAETDRAWRAISQVAGRIIETHPTLRSGAKVEAGLLLVRIDPTDANIAIASASADVDRIRAELAQLDVEKANSEASLTIEQEIRNVAEAEMRRIESLVAKDASSPADLEAKQRALLTQRQTVQSIQSTLALIPTRTTSLNAQLAGAQATLDNAQRDLTYCEIHAPFAGVLGEVDLEVGQYIGMQETVVEVFDDLRMRVDAALPQGEVFRLLDDATRQTIVNAMREPERRQELLDGLFDVSVHTHVGSRERQWPGMIVGARESLDAQTRALRLTVVVQQTPEAFLDQAGPPLTRGTFCEIEIRSKARRGVIVIPRTALRGNQVLVLDAENRLRRADVEIDFSQGELAILRGGIDENARIIVSDPTPAIDGMLVTPVADDALLERIKADAEGTPR